MEEGEKKREKKTSDLFVGDAVFETFVEGVVKGVEFVGDVVPNVGVIDFLKDKFNIAGNTAVEVATKLPQAVIEKIENFDGEGLSNIASAVSDTIKSIELADIDLPDIDI